MLIRFGWNYGQNRGGIADESWVKSGMDRVDIVQSSSMILNIYRYMDRVFPRICLDLRSNREMSRVCSRRHGFAV